MKTPILGYCDWYSKALYAGKIVFNKVFWGKYLGITNIALKKCRDSHAKSK
jgi:hypothetical protein